jgi:hypothetical protein
MSLVFITWSAGELRKMTVKLLVEQRHRGVLHARNEKHAEDLFAATPSAQSAVIGDLSTLVSLKKSIDDLTSGATSQL